MMPLEIKKDIAIEETIITDNNIVENNITGDNATKANITEAITTKNSSAEKEICINSTSFDDDAIVDLVKRRLSIKRDLVGQAMDMLLIFSTMLIIANLYDFGGKMSVYVIFCIFWGIRFLIRVIKFVKPSFKNGITAYFKERRRQEFESEYNRLRKMSKEGTL